MNKYKKLINNSLIFAIGNFGNRALQFLLVPLYSFTLTTGQFGKVDVLVTLISLLSPIACLDIYDAVFRYALDKKYNKENIFGTGFVFLSIISIILFFVVFLLFFLKVNSIYYLNIILLIVTMSFSLFSNYARAIGKVKVFAIAGIIDALALTILNVLFLYFLKLAIVGYLLSMILAYVISLIYLSYMLNISKYISLKNFSVTSLKKMLIYSIPLIPNSLAWWLNSSSDRFFILLMLGAGSNGIYAMANKIPSVVNILSNVFFQSWQMSVVEEFSNQDSKKFITKIFGYFITFLFLCAIAILSILRPIFKMIINSTYYEAWKLTPLILLAVIYSGVSAFLGTIYTASKKTVPIFITTLIGAVINVLSTIIFIKLFGINGAALANALSFFVVSCLRFRDIFKMDKIKIDLKNLIINHLIFFVIFFLMFRLNNDFVFFVVCIVLIIIELLINKELLNIILKKVKKL